MLKETVADEEAPEGALPVYTDRTIMTTNRTFNLEMNFDTSSTALCLSAIVRLQAAFYAETSPVNKHRFLCLAADVLDRTVPAAP
ncbi:hypothetical protein LC612_37420, partial [Nostoc sp. CHAB 5834]|nr:hypothetical protein [Nostoc sp. CHAB 5834]